MVKAKGYKQNLLWLHMMLPFECSLHSQAVLSKPVESFHMQYWVSLWRHCWSTHYTVLTRITRQNLSELQKHHSYSPFLNSTGAADISPSSAASHWWAYGSYSCRRSRGAGKGKEEGGREGKPRMAKLNKKQRKVCVCNTTWYVHWSHIHVLQVLQPW